MTCRTPSAYLNRAMGRRQFRRYFDKARREPGILARNLMRHLERRLDNVVYGDVITLRPGAAIEPAVRAAAESTAAVPAWLLADHDKLSGRVERLPEGHESDAPVNPQLIVELYSK